MRSGKTTAPRCSLQSYKIDNDQFCTFLHVLVKHTYTKAMCRKDGGLKTFPLFVPPSSIIFLSFLCNGVERRRLGLRLNAQECTFKAKMEEGFMYTFLPQGISPNVFKFHSEMNLLFITRDVDYFFLYCTIAYKFNFCI